MARVTWVLLALAFGCAKKAEPSQEACDALSREWSQTTFNQSWSCDFDNDCMQAGNYRQGDCNGAPVIAWCGRAVSRDNYAASRSAMLESEWLEAGCLPLAQLVADCCRSPPRCIDGQCSNNGVPDAGIRDASQD